MYRIVYPAADGRLLAARSRVVVGSRSTRPRFPFQSDRSYTLRVRAGKVGDDGKEDKLGEDDKGGEDGGDGSKLGDLFQRELQKRNISSVDDIQEDANRSGSARPDASSSYVPPPQFASGFGPPDEEDDGVGGDQLARSRRIGSEGLDGLIPRGSQLLTLGATSFLAFGPFILFVLLSFGAVYMAFGDFFVHSGTPASGPPVYYDPADLLAEPTADPMIPM
jgi:hypothetical protein